MIRATLTLLLLALTLATPTLQASPHAHLVPNESLVGEARFKWFLLKVYDAQLFAPGGTYRKGQPYRLRLTYLINANKERIIEETVSEMQRTRAASDAQIQRWVPVMEDAFISMRKGSSADFIRSADGRLTLATAGRVISVIDDRALAQAIMNIWLGPNVRDLGFQNQLMGRGR